MKHIKLFENFEYELIKEDILELKQMSKQMYSYFKNKGFDVSIRTEMGSGREKPDFKASTKIDLSPQVQLIVQEGTEIVWVVVPATGVVKAILGIKSDDYSNQSSQEIEQKFGSSTPSVYRDHKEVIDYVNKLGEELSSQLKSKYSNMSYSFSSAIEGSFFIMQFGYEHTKKGGDVDLKQKERHLQNRPKQ